MELDRNDNDSREQLKYRMYDSAAHHPECSSLHVRAHFYNALVRQCRLNSRRDAQYSVSEKSFRGLTPTIFVEYRD